MLDTPSGAMAVKVQLDTSDVVNVPGLKLNRELSVASIAEPLFSELPASSTSEADSTMMIIPIIVAFSIALCVGYIIKRRRSKNNTKQSHRIHDIDCAESDKDGNGKFKPVHNLKRVIDNKYSEPSKCPPVKSNTYSLSMSDSATEMKVCAVDLGSKILHNNTSSHKDTDDRDLQLPQLTSKWNTEPLFTSIFVNDSESSSSSGSRASSPPESGSITGEKTAKKSSIFSFFERRMPQNINYKDNEVFEIGDNNIPTLDSVFVDEYCPSHISTAAPFVTTDEPIRCNNKTQELLADLPTLESHKYPNIDSDNDTKSSNEVEGQCEIGSLSTLNSTFVSTTDESKAFSDQSWLNMKRPFNLHSKTERFASDILTIPVFSAESEYVNCDKSLNGLGHFWQLKNPSIALPDNSLMTVKGEGTRTNLSPLKREPNNIYQSGNTSTIEKCDGNNISQSSSLRRVLPSKEWPNASIQSMNNIVQNANSQSIVNSERGERNDHDRNTDKRQGCDKALSSKIETSLKSNIMWSDNTDSVVDGALHRTSTTQRVAAGSHSVIDLQEEKSRNGSRYETGPSMHSSVGAGIGEDDDEIQEMGIQSEMTRNIFRRSPQETKQSDDSNVEKLVEKLIRKKIDRKKEEEQNFMVPGQVEQ